MREKRKNLIEKPNLRYDLKAIELANKFVRKSIFDMTDDELKDERKYAKDHAMVCVEEIIRAISVKIDHSGFDSEYNLEVQKSFTYWYEVREALEDL